MPMGIGVYYHSNYCGRSSSVKNAKKADAADQLRNNIQAYSAELNNKFPDLNITTGVYKVGSAAGSGLGNVMIHPEYLRKAANDPKVAARLEKDLAGIPEAEKAFAAKCQMSGMKLIAGGTIIDADGGMSSWSVTQTTSGENGSSFFERNKSVLGKGLKKSDYKTTTEEEGKRMYADKIIKIKEAAAFQQNMDKVAQYFSTSGFVNIYRKMNTRI